MLNINSTDRQFIAVDLENVCGEPYPLPRVAALLFDQVLLAAGWKPGDHVVAATNRYLAAGVAFLRPDVAWRLRVSPAKQDGADELLLEELSDSDLPVRFSRVSIASGDHCFAPVIARLVARGCQVRSVVSPLAETSREIRLAAPEVVRLDLPKGMRRRRTVDTSRALVPMMAPPRRVSQVAAR